MNSISYSDDFEKVLKDEAEKAESMSILHNNAYQKFSKLSIGLNIPVIIISSVIGFMSPLTLFESQQIFLGGMSIGVAILKTIDNYFDISKRCETHRLVGNAYGRVSKWIQLQLSLERECRVSAKDLFDIISNEMQNIREAEPLIPDDIINQFNNKYKKEKTAKPAITNGLTVVSINRNSINRPIFDLPILRNFSGTTEYTDVNTIVSPTSSDTSNQKEEHVILEITKIDEKNI